MSEEWKPIKGAESYEISSYGKVWSIKRGGRIMRPSSTNSGYDMVQLFCNGLYKQVYIHRIVAQNFLANTEKKKYVNHIDADKRNNKASNLEWVTHEENTKHYREMVKCGQVIRKEKGKKLTVVAINEIVNNKDNLTIDELSIKYNRHYTTIWRIRKRTMHYARN